MSAPVPYFDVIRPMKNPFDLSPPHGSLRPPARDQGGAGIPNHRANSPQMAAALPGPEAGGPEGTLRLSPFLPAHDHRPTGRTRRRLATPASHLRGPAPEARVGSAPES